MMADIPAGTEPLPLSDGATNTTKVAIIEDRREIREGLQMLINGTDSYRCTGTYRSMEDALSGIGADVPDVALVDIGLPGMSGIEGIALLKRVIQTCCC
jgi:DNA-binding NarL/FixJ family response regulator